MKNLLYLLIAALAVSSLQAGEAFGVNLKKTTVPDTVETVKLIASAFSCNTVPESSDFYISSMHMKGGKFATERCPVASGQTICNINKNTESIGLSQKVDTIYQPKGQPIYLTPGAFEGKEYGVKINCFKNTIVPLDTTSVLPEAGSAEDY